MESRREFGDADPVSDCQPGFHDLFAALLREHARTKRFVAAALLDALE